VASYGAHDSYLKIISRKVKVLCVMCMSSRTVLFTESRSLGLDSETGGIFYLQLHMCARPIANKDREGNMQRTLRRGLNVLNLLERERMKHVGLGNIASYVLVCDSVMNAFVIIPCFCVVFVALHVILFFV